MAAPSITVHLSLSPSLSLFPHPPPPRPPLVDAAATMGPPPSNSTTRGPLSPTTAAATISTTANIVARSRLGFGSVQVFTKDGGGRTMCCWTCAAAAVLENMCMSVLGLRCYDAGTVIKELRLSAFREATPKNYCP